MTSLLLKCIPCTRHRRESFSKTSEESQPAQVYAIESSAPVETRLHRATFQLTPEPLHARGFEIVEMGTVGTEGNGINTDIKTTTK